MEPIRSIEPQIPSPNDLPNPKSPWIMSQSVFDRVQSSADKGSYKICELSNMDPEWSFVQEYFQAHKPNNRSIKRACCIHNADSTRQFEALIPSLEKEANIPAFAPKWQQEEEAPLRQIAMNRFERLSGMYTAPLISSNQRQTNYQNVTVLPLWHGTTAAICDSICKTGFAFFGKHQHIHSSGNTDQNTDIGYFGSGIYFTNSARYAADIYSDGNLILAYVSMRKPYPVVADCSYPAKPRDMKKLGGLGAYENYNAHYIPVISIDPTNQKCAVYYPCALNQSPALDEFVVFQKSQALARFWLELDIDLPKSLPSATITNITIEIFLQKVLDLLDSDSIQQDQEVYALLEGKSDILFAMNPYETLKEADLKFYNGLLQILDQSGKIRGIVKKRFLQIEQPTSPPIAQLSHVSNLNIPQMIQPICRPSTPLPSTPMEKAQALYDFTGHDSSTLSFKKGDIIHIIEKKGDWWKGELNGKTGYVPSNFMQLIQVLAPISILPQIPISSIAFGKAKWATYFGDIGEEPPLPNNIQTILSSPCPFWPNKKVEETHLLV
ncbi:MAG: SH3 domain-containing protein, partial [Parachlamydiaceae bacterium]